MEREADYLLRRERHARRMERSARSRSARKAHRALASAYAARRVAMGPCSLVEGTRWSRHAPFTMWMAVGVATMLMIAVTYLQIG